MASSSALDTVRSDSAICDRDLVIYSQSALFNHDHLRTGGPLCVQTSPHTLGKSSGLHAEGIDQLFAHLHTRSPLSYRVRAPQLRCATSSVQRSTFDVQPRLSRSTLVSRRADRGVYERSMVTGRFSRCANNIDRLPPRYSSHRVLSTCLHYRTSMAHRTHATIVFITSTKSLHPPIQSPSTAPSDLTSGSFLFELRTIFEPLGISQPAKILDSPSTGLVSACYVWV